MIGIFLCFSKPKVFVSCVLLLGDHFTSLKMLEGKQTTEALYTCFPWKARTYIESKGGM